MQKPIINKQVAADMRRQGASISEIAEFFGVTHQAVQQILSNVVRARKNEYFIESIPYKGIYEYFIEHKKMTVPAFARVMYDSCAGRAETERARRLLAGASRTHVTKAAIDRLIRFTGKTYEQLFELREGFEEDDDA